jgi:diguanylate cyclase (GGDEF)-like protein
MELFGMEAVVPIMPFSFLNSGCLEEGSVQEFINFFEAINRGDASGEMNAQMRRAKSEEYTWYHIIFTTIYSGDGKAISAIISCEDISDLHEKEVAYRRWRQNVEAISQDSIVCYEHNLTKDICERQEGKSEWLLRSQVPLKWNEMANYSVTHFVWEEDRERFLNFFSRERLQHSFRSGTAEEILEYRQESRKGPRWVRSTVQMIEDPYSPDIRAFIHFRDIDSKMKEQIRLQTQSREDALTGLLNRSEFVSQINKLLASSPPGTQHVFLMIDLDGFKQVNDRLGHVVGDRVLSEISHDLKALLRLVDLIGRLGGDEVMLCLKNIPYDDVIERRAILIRKLLTKKLNSDLTITGGLGVAMYPRDGLTFDALYHRADLALYQAKAQGRNRYVFYHASMENGAYTPANTSGGVPAPDVCLQSERNKRLDDLIRENDAVVLRQSEDERYRLVMENSTRAIIDWNAETSAYFCSESFSQYEISRVDEHALFTGTAPLHGVHPKDMELAGDIYRRIREGDPVVEAALHLLKTNGIYVMCRVMVISIFGSDKKRIRTIVTFTDIPMKKEL